MAILKRGSTGREVKALQKRLLEVGFNPGEQGGEYVFDYIPVDDEPPRSLLGQCLSDLRHRLTNPPPPFAYDERTRLDVVADLRAAGFSSVEAIDTRAVARNWSLPHADVPTRTIIYHCRCD